MSVVIAVVNSCNLTPILLCLQAHLNDDFSGGGGGGVCVDEDVAAHKIIWMRPILSRFKPSTINVHMIKR